MTRTHVAGAVHSGQNFPGPQWLSMPEDVNALDPKLWPETASRDSAGMLQVGGVSVENIVTQYGSPVFVVDEADFRTRARNFRDAFHSWAVYYAAKAFLTRDIAKWAISEGLNLDVCSGNEMLVAASAGVPGSKMGLHGNNKSVAEIRIGLKLGVGRIIVDSLDEIERIEQVCKELNTVANVLVRVTPGVEAHTHEYIATAHEDQKFGFSISKGMAMQAMLRCHYSPQIKLQGIHCHIGSQIFETDGFKVAAQRCIELMADFTQATEQVLEELDLGGGYGIAYTCQDDPKTPAELSGEMKRLVEETSLRYGISSPQMSIEPGRAIVGPTTFALYTVGTVKQVYLDGGGIRTYISVDGGMSDNIRPALYDADYSAVLANRVSQADPVMCRIVGKHCEGGDILVHDVFLPSDITPGDLIAVPAMGAYSRAMASNYNYITKPAVVSVKNESTNVLLRRETYADLVNLDQGQEVFDVEGLL